MFDRVALDLRSPLCTFENSTNVAKYRSILILFRSIMRKNIRNCGTIFSWRKPNDNDTTGRNLHWEMFRLKCILLYWRYFVQCLLGLYLERKCSLVKCVHWTKLLAFRSNILKAWSISQRSKVAWSEISIDANEQHCRKIRKSAYISPLNCSLILFTSWWRHFVCK